MSTLYEFNPRDAIFELDGKIYEFSAFNLSAKVWAHYEFATPEEKSGLKNLAALFAQTDLIAVGKVLYFLLKDKTDFPTEEKFVKRFCNIRDSHSRLYGLVNQIFGASEAEMTDEEKSRAEVLGK